MRKFLFIIFILKISFTYCGLIKVDQEGNGDYLTIEEAIEVAVDFDTILVYPGEYHEDIVYMGKTIVVGSMNLTTGEDQYIHSTIINGDNHRRGVTVEEYNGSTSEEGTKIVGFTITNGREGVGGGIYIEGEGSFLEVRNCLIEHNVATNSGGGVIAASGSEIYLSGSTIRNNRAVNQCGGVIVSRTSSGEFDQNNLCNIYGNYSPLSCDIGIWNDLDEPEYFEVYLDTFSCLVPDRYFITHGNDGNNHDFEYLDMHVNTAYYEFYDGDLYVSPEGDDNNSGISNSEPMQTIAGAMTRIISDPEDPNTIHLSPGVYSPALNNQKFAINMKAYVNIIGEDMESVIWEGPGRKIVDYYSGFEYKIKNITIAESTPSARAMYFYRVNMEPRSVYLENIKADSIMGGLFHFSESIEFDMKNIFIEDSRGSLFGYYSGPGNHSRVENVYSTNAYGFFRHSRNSELGEDSVVDIINYLCVDNYRESLQRVAPLSYMIHTVNQVTTNLINCTIMNNQYICSEPSTCLAPYLGSNMNIYNSVIYGNDGYQIYIFNDNPNHTTTLNISHSVLEGGLEGIGIDSINPVYINWLEGSMDCDPLVCEDYTPQRDSPLIDAGMLELPGGIELPETDIYGNPRIYGNNVDIGAIEWQGTPAVFDELVYEPMEITVYPNPFNPETTISFRLMEDIANLNIKLYNIKGQLVRNLINTSMNRGNHQVIWKGETDSGEQSVSGIYFYRITTDNNTETGRMMLIK